MGDQHQFREITIGWADVPWRVRLAKHIKAQTLVIADLQIQSSLDKGYGGAGHVDVAGGGVAVDVEAAAD